MKIRHIRTLIYVVVRACFVLAAVFALARGDFEAMAIALIGLAASVVPQFIMRRYQIKLPLLYELIIIGFVVASLLFGELLDAYSHIWWWDSMLHLSSGIIIGYIGFIILWTLYLQDRLNVAAGMMAFLTFSVSMMVAAIWEVIEFSVDQIYGATMQHGNFDTMKDIVLAMFGSLLATAAAYWHHRWPERSPLNQALRKFFAKNSHLVPKRKAKAAGVGH